MAATTQDLAFDELGAAGYTGDLTERLMNWRTVEGLVSWETYRDYIITNGGVGSNFMDAQYAFWLTGLSPSAFSPLDLSPALWIDPSDASSVTISGSSGAYIGPSGLVLPGLTAVDYFSAPDTADRYDTVGDIDVIAKVTATDWTPATDKTIMGRSTSSSQSWYLGLDTAGTLNLIWYTAAAAGMTAVSTVATGLADGATKWVRATLDVDNGASGYDVNFYLSDDGTAWTQLGTTVTGVGTTDIRVSAQDLRVGSRYTGTNPTWAGTIHRAIFKHGIAGTTVFDADFEAATPYVTSFTESSSNAATVTSGGVGALISQLNDLSGNARHLTQATAANMPVYTGAGQNSLNVATFDGVDNSMTAGDVLDLGTNNFSLYCVVKMADANQVVIAKTKVTPAVGSWLFIRDLVGTRVTRFNYESVGGSASANSPTDTSTVANVVGVILDRVAGTSTLRRNVAASGSTTFTPDNLTSQNISTHLYAGGLRNVGDTGFQAGYWLNGFICEIVVVMSALSTGDRDNLETYLKTKWGTP